MLSPLAEVFGRLTDPRQRKGKRYELKVVLTVVVLGLLSGETSVRGIAAWAQEQRWALGPALGSKGGRVPSLGTIQRVLRQVDCQELEAALNEWAQELLSEEEQERWAGLAVDGKTLRGSGEPEQNSWQVLSAFSQRLSVVVGQRTVAEHSSELTEARPLLQALLLAGKLVTLDALHTQRETAQVILEKGGLFDGRQRQPAPLTGRFADFV